MPVVAFLEGAVHALRSAPDPVQAKAIYDAVRASSLYDQKLGMYRVNAPLDEESFEIGRSRIFSPGWLENESIFLHMHYKFLLETLIEFSDKSTGMEMDKIIITSIDLRDRPIDIWIVENIYLVPIFF